MTEQAAEKVTDNLLWVDIETTGLDKDIRTRGEIVLEIGFACTDASLNIIDAEVWARKLSADEWKTFHSALPFVKQMHSDSGLWEQLDQPDECFDDDEIISLAADFVSRNGLNSTTPVCGSSLRLDRNFLDYYFPELLRDVSYRSIDVSTFKETIRRFEPVIFAGVDDCYPHKGKCHRPLQDIENSVAEYRHYLRGLGLI